MTDPTPQAPPTSEIRAALAVLDQPLRRGYRTLPQHTWVGVVWSKVEGPGKEIAECGHRHFIGPEEAMQCPGLDEHCPANAVESDLQANAPTWLAQLCDALDTAEARAERYRGALERIATPGAPSQLNASIARAALSEEDE